MNALLRLAALAAIASTLFLAPGSLLAQNRQNRQNQGGNFDPAQAQQRMMERYKEQFAVTNDDEWKVMEPRIQKVMDARREVGMGGAGRALSSRGGAGGGSADNAAGGGA